MNERVAFSGNECELKKLFEYERIPTASAQRVIFLLYLPVGLIVWFFRLFLAFHAFLVSCILRKTSQLRCTVLRFLCAILGAVVREKGRRNVEAKVIVSNHVSPMDHAAFELLQPCVLPSVWNLPALLMWCFGYADLGARTGRQTLINRAKQFCRESSLPLLAFPEGAMTNGRVGLLKFNSWPFALEQPVQLAKISIHRPTFLNLAPTVIGSRWWTDLLWLLFVPYTIFEIEWLGTVTRKEAESEEEFANRAQATIGKACGGLATTGFTSHEVVEFAKRMVLEAEQKRRAQQQLANSRAQKKRKQTTGPELDAMALRVKEMLPQVPLHVIRKDLERTESVELTSSNLIEGVIPYTPETINTVKSAQIKLPNSVSSDPCAWRSIYEERKWAMIEENRQKYIERNNLKL